jgi:AcrR family transcriptional regulator
MNPTRKEQTKRTREAIIVSATELFFAKGFSEVSTDEIAEKAGVAKGTIFHHFDSKVKLALAVFKNFMEQYQKSIPEDIQERSPKEIMNMFLDQTIEIGFKQTGFTKMLIWLITKVEELDRTDSPDEEFINLMKDSFLPILQLVEGLFEQMDSENSTIKAVMLVAMLDGLSFYTAYLSKLIEFYPSLEQLQLEPEKLKEVIKELFDI